MNVLNRHRSALAALIVGLAVFGSACVSWHAETPAQRYYAALADYTIAKQAAAHYAVAPSTPASHVKVILDVVEATDKEIATFNETLASLPAQDDSWAAASQVIAAATRQLRSSLATGGIFQ